MSGNEVSGFCRLASEVLLRLDGIDAKKVLQGQTTANFEAAKAGDVVAGAFCDVKGRVLADFLTAVVTDEQIFLRLNRDVAARLQIHLKPYLMFSKSTLTATECAVIGALGQTLAASLNVDRFSHHGDALAICLGPEQYELWFINDQNTLPETSMATQLWQRATILRGEARIALDTIGKYLPQDLNYDLNGWVNFKKGCYTGQEIIARLHYRGTPKRRLIMARYTGSETLSPGTPLYVADRTQAAGSVVNVAAVSNVQWLLVECIDDALALGLTPLDDDTALTAA